MNLDKWTSHDLGSLIAELESGSRPKGGADDESGELPSLGGENIRSDGRLDVSSVRKVPRSFFAAMNKGFLRNEDVLINKDGANTGKVGIYRGEFFEAAINEHVFRLRGREGKLHQGFLFYFLASQIGQQHIRSRISGSAQPGLKSSFVDQLPIALPNNYDVQPTVAKILEWVDLVIEQTGAQVTKQHRIKTGLMHDLLTRGLDAQGCLRDPSTHTFKPSPLGPIPSEWTTVNIEDLCDDIVDCPHSTPRYESGGIPCIRTADMAPGKLLLNNVYRVSSSTYQERISRLVPRKGDIIYSREGERLGIASPVGDELICLGQRVMLLRPKADTDSTFLTWAMNSPSFYNRMVLGQIATTSPHINVRDIKKALIVRPEPSEQLLIGEALAADDSEKAMLEDCLEKLCRLKGGLMHDLLTGLVPVAPLLANPQAPISS